MKRNTYLGALTVEPVVEDVYKRQVSRLGDRWSYYLTAEELEAQNQRRTNQYVGVGITVNYTREEGLYILGVETGGPAEAAGLEAGEVITAVDGVSLAGESRYEGANLIQGEADTTVTLEVLGEDGTARTVEVERAELETDPVESRMLEGKVGYVRLLNFYDHSAQRLEEAVTQLREQGAEALVFDMRNNGGGYLSQLTDMLDFLLPEGPIFISRDRAGHEEITYSGPECVELPMACLLYTSNRQLDDEMEGAAEIQAEIARKQKQLEEERRQNNVTIDSETNYLWPLPGYYRLTSLFGYRIHPITGKAHSHTGIDIPAPGGTPIQACKSGQVVTSAYHYSYGNYVVIDHGNGNSTLYAHMSSRAVSEGQMVSQGQTIGYVGTTGSSTGNHLHLEVRDNYTRVDPESKFPSLSLTHPW